MPPVQNPEHQRRADLINQIAAYLNDSRPPISATAQQTVNVVNAFNELIKPMIDEMNAAAPTVNPGKSGK